MNASPNLKNWAAYTLAGKWYSFAPHWGVEKRKFGKSLWGLCNLAESSAYLPLDRLPWNHSPALVLTL